MGTLNQQIIDRYNNDLNRAGFLSNDTLDMTEFVAFYISHRTSRTAFGVAAQTYSVLRDCNSPSDAANALRNIIRSTLANEDESQARVKMYVDAGRFTNPRHKDMSFRWMLKNVPFQMLALIALTESHHLPVELQLQSLLVNGSWANVVQETGLDLSAVKRTLGNELLQWATQRTGMASLPTIADVCALWPQGPYPNGYSAGLVTQAATASFSISTPATAATPVTVATTTQGVNTMTNAIASINPALKPIIDGVLTQSGVGLTIDSILTEIAAKAALETTLASVTRQHDEEMEQMRKALAAKASMPSTMTLPSASLSIPSGKMEMVQASSIFPQLGSVNLLVPKFTWDHAHPDVPVVNDHYLFRNEMLVKALRCLATGEDNLWVHGHTGSGKTTFLEQIAARLQWPTIRVAFDSNVDRAELVGRMNLKPDGNGGTASEWLPGAIERALSGGYMLIVDEIDAGHPNSLYVLQPVLENKGLTLLEDGGRIVARSPVFRIAATGNTTGCGDPSGLYPACRILSAATLERFQTFIHVPYLALDEEVEMLGRYVPGLNKTMLKKIAKFAGELRNAFTTGQTPIGFSPRRSVAFAKEVVDLQAMGFNDETAVLTSAFRSKLYDAASEEFRQRLTEIANAVFSGIDPSRNLL